MNDDKVLIGQKKGKKFFRKGDKFIKLYPKDFPREAVYLEAFCQAQLHANGLAVPVVYDICEVGGQLSLTMDYIAESCESTLEQFIDVAVHLAKTKIHVLPRQSDFVDSVLGKSGFSDVVKANIKKRLKVFSSMPLCICHGDLHQKNIIVDCSGRVNIIDCEYTTNGNLLLDLARTYILYSICGVYGTAEDYICDVCRRMGYDVSDVRYLIPVAGALHYVISTNAEKKKLLLEYVQQLDNQ